MTVLQSEWDSLFKEFLGAHTVFSNSMASYCNALDFGAPSGNGSPGSTKIPARNPAAHSA
jgi:hypothetical protein